MLEKNYIPYLLLNVLIPKNLIKVQPNYIDIDEFTPVID